MTILDDIVEKLSSKLGDGFRIDILAEEGGFGITTPTEVEIVVRLACPNLRPENRKVSIPQKKNLKILKISFFITFLG
jgi:hypothetical protein